jgi:hypothetical protein
LTVGTGYVGHCLLTELLLEVLKASAPSRIVVVTGSAEKAAVLDWDDIGYAHPLPGLLGLGH